MVLKTLAVQTGRWKVARRTPPSAVGSDSWRERSCRSMPSVALRDRHPTEGAAQHRGILQLALFQILTVSIDLGVHKVEVEVDVPLAHLTTVICIGEPGQGFRLLAGLHRVEVVDEKVILPDIFVIDDLVGAPQEVGQVGTHTDRVMVRQLPVESTGVSQTIIEPSHGVGAILTERVSGVGLLPQGAVLTIVLVVVPHPAEHIHCPSSIVEVQSGVGAP